MNKIKHSGIIESTEDRCVHVRILQSSACGSCAVASHCSASEAKEKMVDIYDRNAGIYQKGQLVTIATDGPTGFKAVLFGYGLPLIVLIAVLVFTIIITGNETIAALLAIASLVPYYIILYLLRDKINRQVNFTIEKINN